MIDSIALIERLLHNSYSHTRVDAKIEGREGWTKSENNNTNQSITVGRGSDCIYVYSFIYIYGLQEALVESEQQTAQQARNAHLLRTRCALKPAKCSANGLISEPAQSNSNNYFHFFLSFSPLSIQLSFAFMSQTKQHTQKHWI